MDKIASTLTQLCNPLVITRQNEPITSICIDFSLGSRKDFRKLVQNLFHFEADCRFEPVGLHYHLFSQMSVYMSSFGCIVSIIF